MIENKNDSDSDSDWLFGLHTVYSVLKTSGSKIKELRVQKGRDDQRFKKIINLAQLQDIPLVWVLRSDLDILTGGSHQGVAALSESIGIQDENYLFKLIIKEEKNPVSINFG